MSQNGTLRTPDMPEQPGYHARSQMDFYKLGAAQALGIDPKDVSTAQRNAFKVAFMETVWTRLFGDDRAAFVMDMRHAASVISDGLDAGHDEETICNDVVTDLLGDDELDDEDEEQAVFEMRITGWGGLAIPFFIFVFGAVLLLLLRTIWQ